MGSIGCVFEGTDATLVTNYNKHEVYVAGKLVDDPRPAETIPDSAGQVREFLDAIRSRNLDTTCNVRYGKKASAYLHRKFRKPWSLKVQPKPAGQGARLSRQATLR